MEAKKLHELFSIHWDLYVKNLNNIFKARGIVNFCINKNLTTIVLKCKFNIIQPNRIVIGVREIIYSVYCGK